MFVAVFNFRRLSHMCIQSFFILHEHLFKMSTISLPCVSEFNGDLNVFIDHWSTTSSYQLLMTEEQRDRAKSISFHVALNQPNLPLRVLYSALG